MTVYDKITNLLDEHKIIYTSRRHEATLTSVDSARVRGELLSSGAKAILYKIQDHFFLMVFAADRKIDTKLLKSNLKEIGVRAKKSRFATKEELFEMTGLVPGSVPPFGPPILDIPLFVDPSLLSNESISFNAGDLERSISMSLDDYIRISKPRILQFCN